LITADLPTAKGRSSLDQGGLQTDHGHFHLYRTGLVGRSSVELAHGLSGSAKCWWRVADALAERYDVITRC
jgi:hypothetical protein